MPVDYNDGEHPNLMQIGVFITITVRPLFFNINKQILCFLE